MQNADRKSSDKTSGEMSATISRDSREPGFLSILWNWLYSLKLTIFLLILLAVLSILGTVIPQNQPAAEYLKFYTPVKYRFYLAMGLLDMYHSWWFITLLGLLSLNLTACSWRRIPVVLRHMSGSTPLLTDRLANSCAVKHSLHAPRPPEGCLSEAQTILGKSYRNVTISASGDSIHLVADRGRFARLGVLITHASVLFILLGGMVGSIFGFKGFVNIVEGESVDQVFLQKSPAPLPLGFTVRCDKFDVDFYDDGTPKDYRSALTVLEGGKEILKRDVRVNHPLVYRGITFYQSSYGNAGPPRFELEIRNRQDGPSEVKRVKFQQTFSPSTGDGAFRIVDYRESVMGRGPAVRIAHFRDSRRAGDFWVFRGAPTTRDLDGNSWTFVLNGVHQPRFTGLQVARDPGVWMVWIGSTLMVIGMMVAFFMSHRKIWVRITPEKKGSRILLAGRSTRNPISFHKEFERIAGLFSSMAPDKKAPERRKKS
ncbi:MAG: cytochrome c biogenesis protein ResB [Deltaproteobacteria bacterium]|nr:cytochrome c biogenesis protein ResB [Deltaproteobacteria bacterium]